MTSPTKTQTSRVLSIQSHVAFGYVGGKAAVFPLQCLGYDVDVINTVNFSNHTGYGRFGGTRTNAADLAAMFDSMEANGLLFPGRLLTGYIPGAEAVAAVQKAALRLKARTPNLIYLLDPVLGDSGKLYVAPDVIPIYREMLPYSTIITPNWFEVEVLTDVKVKDYASLRQAVRVLHEQYRVPNVVISSIPLRPWLKDHLPSQACQASDDAETDYLLCICSSMVDVEAPTFAAHVQCVPCLPGYFSGVGDLFSALVLAHFHSSDDASTGSLADGETWLSHAVSHALSKTHAMLTLTNQYASALPEEDRLPTDEELDARDQERKIRRMRGRELRLIQGQDILRGTKSIELRRMLPWTAFWESS